MKTDSPSVETRTMSEANLAGLLSIVRSGHWSASVFHCPDKKGWPRGGIAGAQTLSVDGKYESEAAALNAASAAMKSGRIRDVFVHGPTATPTAYYKLSHQQINAIGRIAKDIPASRKTMSGDGLISNMRPMPARKITGADYERGVEAFVRGDPFDHTENQAWRDGFGDSIAIDPVEGE